MKGDRGAPARLRAVLGLAAQYVLLACLWLILTGPAPSELASGLVAAGLGVLAFKLVQDASTVHVRFRGRTLAAIVHVPGEILSNTWIVLAVLAARLRGRPVDSLMRDMAFDARGSAPELSARESLAVIYGTTSPNFIAVGFEGGRDKGAEELRLIYHQIRATPISASLRRLGAMP